MDTTFRPVLTVRIFGEKKCFGPGMAQLLSRVREYHSLRRAAMSMGMAYSKAWTIVKKAEEELGISLLLTTTGGKNGGGAVLSQEAEKILAAYEGYCQELEAFARDAFEARLGVLLPTLQKPE